MIDSNLILFITDDDRRAHLFQDFLYLDRHFRMSSCERGQLVDVRQMFSKKEVEQTVYGSEKAPFGDTRYLSLLAKQQSDSSSSPVNRGSL
jgi:hypothetical protein